MEANSLPINNLSLRGQADFDSLNSTLQALTAAIQHQDSKISFLFDECKKFSEIIPTIQTKISNLESGLSNVILEAEKACKASISRVHDKIFTAGELASSNFFHLEAIEKKISHCFTYSDFHQHLHSHHYHDHRDSHSSVEEDDPFSLLNINEKLSPTSASPLPSPASSSTSSSKFNDILRLGEKEHLSILSKDLPTLREHLFESHQREDHEDHYISKAAKNKFNMISNLLKKNSLIFNDFNNEIDNIKKSLELKLSKSFLTNIENIINNLREYDTFQKNITEKVLINEKNLNSNIIIINDNKNNINNLNNIIENILINNKKYSTKKEIHLLANEIEKQNEKLKLFVKENIFYMLENNFNILNKDFKKLENNVQNLTKNVNNIEEELPMKATISDLLNYFKRDDYIKDRSYLLSEINSKSSNLFAEKINENTIELAKYQVEDRQAIDILLNFVQWYLSRGQHLEHNLSIIDKHLKDLVSSRKAQRVHSVRLPNGAIQFSPVKTSLTAEAARAEARAGQEQANYEAMKGYISFSDKL